MGKGGQPLGKAYLIGLLAADAAWTASVGKGAPKHEGILRKIRIYLLGGEEEWASEIHEMGDEAHAKLAGKGWR